MHCTVVACITTASAISDPVVLRSYFGKGFGRVIEQKCILKSIPVKLWARTPPAKQWFLFKATPDVGKDAPQDGIRVVFASKTAEDELGKLAVASNGLEVQVTGHESVLSDGEATPGKEITSTNEFNTVPCYVFRIERVFMLRSLESRLNKKDKAIADP